MREQKIIPQANDIQRKAGIVVIISDKIDFKIKKVQRDKDGHFIIIKRTTDQADITVIDIYALKLRALKYIK